MSTTAIHVADFRAQPISYIQRFSVQFDYPVYFTRGLFTQDNPILAETLARLEPAQRHRFVAFVDQAVATAMPNLIADITAYATRHAARLELVAPPEIVPGGEETKNSLAQVDRLRRRLFDLGIDRHSCVVAI